MQKISEKFPSCDLPLGLYPIVDSADWLQKLLPLGVKTLQLRIKNKKGLELENEIQAGIALAKKYHAKLFINDYWQLAIKHGAYGVHLGQEDLTEAGIVLIREAGLRLGISTHCYDEIVRAYDLHPSYIAFGPVFPTTSKEMKFAPQGVVQLRRWQRMLDCPVVAVGGINSENLADVIATRVAGVAVISAITQASDPVAATRVLLAKTSREWGMVI